MLKSALKPRQTGIGAPDRKLALELAEQRYKERLGRKPSSFLSVEDLDSGAMRALLQTGIEMKQGPAAFAKVLANKSVALLFQKTSTRTRCSFEMAVRELGGYASYIDWRTSNFVLADLADEVKSLSRYYDAIMARVNAHETLEIMAADSEAPVINGMSNLMHPCQALGDYMTMTEYFGADLNGLRLSYIGDGNNVCRSLVHGAVLLGVQVTLCSPKGYELDAETQGAAGDSVVRVDDPMQAAREADVIYTDTWVSIGFEDETKERMAAFGPYQVNAKVFSAAPGHALFMHCLPAHPGQEVTPEVLRGPRSVVFDQAENRKHAQKALLADLAGQ